MSPTMPILGIIPRPTYAGLGVGSFDLTIETSIEASTDALPIAHWLSSELRPSTGLPLPVHAMAAAGRDGSIRLSVDSQLPDEGYRLVVSAEVIVIVGGDSAGLFYGCQALRQLLPPDVFRKARGQMRRWTVPAATISDSPRFEWRGVMLDVARHFMTKHDLLRYVDLLALHRFNTLHLHLTDDQGWRVEVKRFPRLTEVGSWRSGSAIGPGTEAPMSRRPHGGFYSQADLREIVAYAADRFITVVPEIDVPGHVSAALAAYPELGVTGRPVAVSGRWGGHADVLNVENSTVEFFKQVIDELLEIFPSQYFGVGGDECPTSQWEADERTLARVRELGLSHVGQLEGWFLSQIGEHLRCHGRRPFAWDEALDSPIDKSTVIGAWRGRVGALVGAQRGHQVVSCPGRPTYLDYRQSDEPTEPVAVSVVTTLEDAYLFDPIPSDMASQDRQQIIGGQANIWTEHMDSVRSIDYMAFPRLIGIADALWRQAEPDLAWFQQAVPIHLERLEAIGVEFRAASGPHPWQRRPDVAGAPLGVEEYGRLIASITESLTKDNDDPAT